MRETTITIGSEMCQPPAFTRMLNDLLNAVFDGSYTDTVNGGGGIDEGHL
jgi:hypothetical protein